MNNMMALWAEAFQKMYPNVKIQIEGKGSSTAPAALIAGTAQFGPMSRQMRATEIDQFEAKYGYKPTELRSSYDALAVYVNKDNPLEKITLAQTDAVFSKTRRRGGKNIATWGDLGLTGDWAARPISLYGRNSASGTYGFFKEHTLKNGDFRDQVKEQPGSASVVQGVTEDRFGIGYSGIGYRTSGVKVLALAETDAFSSGSYDDVKSGKYPLSRFPLYLHQQSARKTAGSTGQGVREDAPEQGRAGSRHQGRLPSASCRDRQGRTGEAGVAFAESFLDGYGCSRGSREDRRSFQTHHPGEENRPRGDLAHHRRWHLHHPIGALHLLLHFRRGHSSFWKGDGREARHVFDRTGAGGGFRARAGRDRRGRIPDIPVRSRTGRSRPESRLLPARRRRPPSGVSPSRVSKGPR